MAGTSQFERKNYRYFGFSPSLTLEATPTNPNIEHRQIISMLEPEDDIDFFTLHNVLYFIYTGTANLREMSEDHLYEFPEGFPERPDLFRLYRNADKFLLPTLKSYCYTNLKHAVNPENVAERLFHKECKQYEELKTLFLDYVVENFTKVKETAGWKRSLCDEDEDSLAVMKYRTAVVYEISQRLHCTT